GGGGLEEDEWSKMERGGPAGAAIERHHGPAPPSCSELPVPGTHEIKLRNSLPFADSCCKDQSPCATFQPCPPARGEPVARNNEESSHGDGLNAISRQTAVGAAGRPAHRHPECKSDRRATQRGVRPVTTLPPDRTSSRRRQRE